MRTVCEKNACTGCMACVEKCKRNAITIKDSIFAYNAVIDETKCVNCGACESVCHNNNKVKMNPPILWKEGWATDDIRMKASSGGAASAMILHFIEKGGYVATCLFKDGEFVFDITNNKERLIDFRGSKYVKSNPIGIYEKIIEKLKIGKKVLFIGLPCQGAALKNYIKSLSVDKCDNLYVVDLICHGTPSPKILTLALREKGVDISKIKNINFREKTKFGVYLQDESLAYKSITPNKVRDMYTYAFLTSLDYTECCYSCRYATTDRISDITIGDSWGSNLSDNEQKKGLSLLLCQTEKGVELVANSGMQLKSVNIEKSIEENHQLKHPSVAPGKRALFFKNLDKGFHKSICKCSPKIYYKQKIKEMLIALNLIHS